jgi:hypothetical protein
MRRSSVSRRRKPKRTTQQTTPSSPVGEEKTLQGSAAVPVDGKQQLVRAVALAGIWWAVLIGLATLTANPVTLNREQIRQADVIVSAKVTHAEKNEAVIEKVWYGAIEAGEVTIEGLSESGVRDGEAYLIPLKRAGAGRLKIAQAGFLDGQAAHAPQVAVRLGPALIYRRTDASIEQLESLLSELKGQ